MNKSYLFNDFFWAAWNKEPAQREYSNAHPYYFLSFSVCESDQKK